MSSGGQRGPDSWIDNYLYAYLLIDAALFVLDILLELLEGGRVGGGAVGLEYRDITAAGVSHRSPELGFGDHIPEETYSSERGVIFFSGSSSSAKFFWYFSQLDPVALGMLQVLTA